MAQVKSSMLSLVFFIETIQFCARCAVVFFAAYVALIVASYQIGPEVAWQLALLQYLPHIYLLPPALLTVALSFTLRRGWQVMSLCCLALFVTYVMGFEFSNRDVGTKQVRLMTYNVKGYIATDQPEGVLPIMREIALHGADIIVLQDSREITAMLLETPELVRSMFGGRQLYTYGQYLVASRYSLRECAPKSISFRDQPHSYVHCVVDINGSDVDLFAVHFVTPRHGLNSIRHDRLSGITEWKQNIDDRMLQASSLAQELRASVRPVIVAGDLNAPNNSLVVRTLLESGVRDAFSTGGKGFGYTYGHSHGFGKSFMRIDHVLVSSAIGIADCFVGAEQGSTHRAVVADLFLE